MLTIFLSKLNQHRLLVCGSNSYGQLGLGSNLEQDNFVECKIGLKQDEIITNIVAGGAHSLVKTSHHRLLVCGINGHGQSGLGHNLNQNSFVECKLELKQGEIITAITAAHHRHLLEPIKIGFWCADIMTLATLGLITNDTTIALLN